MVAVISRRFGLSQLETAEDIVSETFLTAAETWGVKGVPPNPAAWLYAVARQKALYHFRRNSILEKKIIPELISNYPQSGEADDLDFSPQSIKDSQLRMLFAICNPAIASEAQIGLALRILCGFGIDEIAEAFLTQKETINKRLFRARERLRAEKIVMELPSEQELGGRIGTVLHVIYLLFNEGYYSRTRNPILRKELCREAMSLCLLLTEYEKTDLPETSALMALMCFHASRFVAREEQESSPVLYEEQDRELWDAALIRQGIHFFNLSARGNELTSYHLESAIAFWHCQKEDTGEKWENILKLYDQLIRINHSSSAALNRVYAIYKTHGHAEALVEAEKLDLRNNHFYHVLLGEIYKTIDIQKSRSSFQTAMALARTRAEKKEIQKKMDVYFISEEQ